MSKQYLLARLNVSMTRLELLECCGQVEASWKDVPFERRELTAGQALYVWLTSTLSNRKPLRDTERRLLMSHFKRSILLAGDDIGKALSAKAEKMPVYVLSVADNTMAGFTHGEGWLDLRTGDDVENLPRPPIELVSYNLTALFIALDTLYTKRGELDAGRATSTPK